MSHLHRPLQPEVPPWKGHLGQLIHALTRDLMNRPPGTWVRRRMSRGAVVSLMRRPDDRRRLLLLSRDPAPRDLAEWEAEVGTLLGWFHVRTWEPTDDLPQAAFFGIQTPIWSAFLEPRPQTKED